MEWDFLGVVGKEKEPARQSEAIVGGSAMQWPFRMSYQTAREDKTREIAFDQFPSSGVQPINQRPSLLLAPQKSFGIHRVHGYQPQNTDSFSASPYYLNRARMFQMASRHSMPFFVSSPSVEAMPSKQPPIAGSIYLSNPVAGSTFGVFPPRDMSKISAKPAQLTIFYAGAVNVFDNVPPNKAQEIMLSASKAASKIPTVECPRSDSPVVSPAKAADTDGSNQKQAPTWKQNHVSSPISVASQTGTLSRSPSSSNADSLGPDSAGQLASGAQNDSPSALPTAVSSTTAASIMARAVPQARKASLVRFLEKRKERAVNAAPYVKQPMEMNSDTIESGNVPIKSSSIVALDLSMNS